ncbi:antibiotic biosynthesis monooxygenase [Mesorhizobium qingshengii]|uniref:Antibiotic biosynthesis monooxygenase n=1 Tax=Mesorhizobium qingshengii TaxID=1165689 RepID=A0ABT4QQ29_9HYPH|nr:antibiotic biosynthesis monooxygenase [Mesorhizobium qingshengii]MCZ8543667.1 antibiotic biosynthesis monooxygenase [Mesorhizobium qingshengii]
MTAFNSVRFRVKPGLDDEFVELFRSAPRNFAGLRKMALIKSGDGTFFSIGEWDSFQHMTDARPKMIANLDRFRHTLQQQLDGGPTDAVSGEAVFETGVGDKSA